MTMLKYSFLKQLAKRVDQGISPLRWIDLYSAQYVANCHSQNSNPADECLRDVVVLALMTSFVSSKGDTYLALDDLPTDILATYQFQNVTFSDWIITLSQSKSIRQIDQVSGASFPLEKKDGQFYAHTPLILWNKRLYLARYWQLHQQLEYWLYLQSITGQMIEKKLLVPLAEQLKSVFNLPKCLSSTQELNKDSESSSLNWQAISAAHTLIQNFSIITGGPGTGKTTTAASLLYLLMQRHKLQCSEQPDKDVSLKVRLLAPTGKAAIKLADSIRQHLVTIESRLLKRDIKSIRMSDCLPKSGETIHRFLYEHGALRESLNQHRLFSSEEVLLGQQEGRQANVDILVIDEASMIDLALMVELIEVLPPSTQVIMLGDHYQLPAVEPGQVFASCVEKYEAWSYSSLLSAQFSQLSGFDAEQISRESRLSEASKLGDKPADEFDFHPLCQLRKTYRFGGDLKVAAEQIKQGQSKQFKTQFLLNDKQSSSLAVRWHSVNDEKMRASLVSGYRAYFECIQATLLPALPEVVAAFEQFQLLCSTHEGPLGVVQMNALIEQQFAHKNQNRLTNGFYHGKAILVTRNHAHLGVFNGDVGFMMASTKKTNSWNIHFPMPDQNALIIAPGRLREWQPAYAMTVHKSQGSEYQHVGIVLADYAKELLSKALLYTALTRSKLTCDIWASDETLEQAFK